FPAPARPVPLLPPRSPTSTPPHDERNPRPRPPLLHRGRPGHPLSAPEPPVRGVSAEGGGQRPCRRCDRGLRARSPGDRGAEAVPGRVPRRATDVLAVVAQPVHGARAAGLARGPALHPRSEE